jgi:putative transcriptional regulator
MRITKIIIWIKKIFMELGNYIRKLRFENGEMTQQELANAVGVTRVTIYSVESGRFVPSSLLALKIARVFQASFEEVFYLKEEEKDESK